MTEVQRRRAAFAFQRMMDRFGTDNDAPRPDAPPMDDYRTALQDLGPSTVRLGLMVVLGEALARRGPRYHVLEDLLLWMNEAPGTGQLIETARDQDGEQHQDSRVESLWRWLVSQEQNAPADSVVDILEFELLEIAATMKQVLEAKRLSLGWTS